MTLLEALQQARKTYSEIILTQNLSSENLLRHEVHAGLCRHFRGKYPELSRQLDKLYLKDHEGFYWYTPSDFWHNEEKKCKALQKRIELIDILIINLQ